VSDALARLAERLRDESGLSLGARQYAGLGAAVRRAAGVDAEEFERLLEEPGRAAGLMTALVDEAAVKETFLFRHPTELVALDWHAMLATARASGRRDVRVWCAACATGEEAYTLAFLALEAFWPASAPVDVLATDIAPSALAGAAAGRYGARSARHLPDAIRRRWFVPDGGGVRVGEALRRHVRFARHNLAGASFPPVGERPFDLVVCRNVLIYFDPAQVTRTVAGLERSLVPGGRVLLGAADRLSAQAAARGSLQPSRAAGGGPGQGPVALRRPAAPRPPAAGRPAEPAIPDAPDAAACLAKGRGARARGDALAAVKWLRRAVYLEPEAAEAGLELALAHAALEDHAAARRALRHTLGIVTARGCSLPGDDEILAECRSRLGMIDAA
jgi:chemotaxis protein methyltransferase CheR